MIKDTRPTPGHASLATVTTGGVEVPSLGFGTVRLTGSDCRDAVAHALAVGYRHVDTAIRYGNEEEVGAGLAASPVPREDVFLTTKLGFDHLRDGVLQRGVLDSLKRLRTDYVDLLLIHWPSEVPLVETLTAMLDLQRAGHVRHLGVSNFPPSWVRAAAGIAPILANQIEYHPYLSQDALLRIHGELDVITVAYCPLARGEVVGDAVLGEIAADHGKTVAQVTLRWILQQGLTAAVVRSSSAQRRQENFEVFDFALTDEEMGRIHRLDRGFRIIDPEFAPDWER